ncbi:MAG: hypothetical protein ACLQGT_10630 [Terracidiphilus sp.]
MNESYQPSAFCAGANDFAVEWREERQNNVKKRGCAPGQPRIGDTSIDLCIDGAYLPARPVHVTPSPHNKQGQRIGTFRI